VFSLAAGLGSLLGGFLAPRLGRRLVITGSLLATAGPLLALPHLEPGSLPFFVAAALGGVLLYTSSPVMVVAAQDLAPQTPAAASGVVLGLTTGVAGALYIALGRLQETIGLLEGMTVGLAMVIPAAAIALAVLLRHPVRRAGPQRRPAPPARRCANPSGSASATRHEGAASGTMPAGEVARHVVRRESATWRRSLPEEQAYT
jgi:MFS family permease